MNRPTTVNNVETFCAVNQIALHSGAFMAFDRKREMFDVARNFAHFLAHESCGFCTPCRVGTELVLRHLKAF
jgi:NADH:ubiquinone oxidoreductase subunit F (NADH-binding)